jgi:hypothetical protein
MGLGLGSLHLVSLARTSKKSLTIPVPRAAVQRIVFYSILVYIVGYDVFDSKAQFDVGCCCRNLLWRGFCYERERERERNCVFVL